MITHIQAGGVPHREGDIFQLLATHTSRDHFIIRSTYNRKIQYNGEVCDLYETLAFSSSRDTYQLDVRGDIRKNTLNRKAIMELRYIEIEVQLPLKLSKRVPLSPIKVVAIEAKESPSTVPDGQEPVHWRILTGRHSATHQIKDFSVVACQIVYWYSLRWHIETLFRLLKTQGFDIENIELENGEAIIKITLFALWTSLKVMALLLSSKTIFPNQN